jgi:oxaloacetate decarboxylase alpha subunit
MTVKKSPLGITDVILRDAHQSLLATRMRIDDMLPIADKLDQVGFWSLESWGGATFDACIRYLGEDPWDRIREFKKAMPNTPQQMLFRGQNILGYRHYADDLVNKFVERAVYNGVDVFRVFDAMNDMRNLTTAIKAVKTHGGHAQGAMSYTISPVYTLDSWLSMAREIEDMGADSLCIKDMAGLLRPYDAFELITSLKQTLSIPIHMQCHATTGLSVATYIKAVEAGVDNVDTAISSMSMTYGHSPTETVVAMLDGTARDTGLNMELLEEIAAYFREVRKKYASFEGSLKGIDSRILIAQVPGGMLTNLEGQLKEQNALDRFDEVLEEIPRVREDVGFIPLVTPTSQIVGSQAVINVLSGERYKRITKETEGVLKGEYGATPAPVNSELQARVLAGKEPITCRPADLLEPEFDQLKAELLAKTKEEGFSLNQIDDDTLTYALFPQVGLKFLKHRNDPSAFEPAPTKALGTKAPEKLGSTNDGVYTVEVNGTTYAVRVSEGGDVNQLAALASPSTAPRLSEEAAIAAPLSGNIVKVSVQQGDGVTQGQVLLVLEAMKMETEIRSTATGKVTGVFVKAGDAVKVGDPLIQLS